MKIQRMAGLGSGFKGRFSSIGLDLGTSHIKLIQFRRNGKDICTHRCGIFPLPEGSFNDGQITDSRSLSAYLKTIIKELRLKKKNVNMCINNRNVILRSLALPLMPAGEIPGAIRWEIEKHIMLPADEIVTDYVFERKEDAHGNGVIDAKLVAVPGEIVGGYIDTVAGAGLNPRVIEIEPFSLNRALCYFSPGRMAGEGREHVSLLVDMGGEYSNILVSENGKYAFSRTINTGTGHFCRSVAEANAVGAEAAEKLVFGKDPFPVRGFREAADEMAELVQRSVEFYLYRIKEKETSINEILLCGGGALIEGMSSFLSEFLSLQPGSFSLPDFIENDNNIAAGSGGDTEKEKQLLGVAAGLALRGWVYNENGN